MLLLLSLTVVAAAAAAHAELSRQLLPPPTQPLRPSLPANHSRALVATTRIMSFHEVKVCILGDSGVGKSSLVQRFVHNTFTVGNESTIGASYLSKTIVVGDRTIKFNIWDTAGQEKYRALAPMYYRGSQACVIVYDVTSLASYKSVTGWIRELQSHASSEVVLALAANKSDLAPKSAVSVKEAKALADNVGAVFVETSAKNSMNVHQLFVNIVPKLKFSQSRPSSISEPGISLTAQQQLNQAEKKGCC